MQFHKMRFAALQLVNGLSLLHHFHSVVGGKLSSVGTDLD